MDRLTYWRKCLKEGLYKDSYFVKSCLSHFNTQAEEEYLVRKDEQGYYYLDNGNKVYFTDGQDTSKPLLDYREEIIVPDGEIPNYKGELKTTVGRLLQNYLLTIGPFGHRVPYINKRFFPKDIYPLILYRWNTAKALKKPEELTDPNEIFTEDWLVFAENALSLTNYTQVTIPSISEKALTSNPVLLQRMKELFEEYKDTLGEPSTIAKIDAELQKLDKEGLLGDESMGFLIGGKDFATVRKRLFYHFGITTGLDDVPKYVHRPLVKGLDINHMPEYVNDAYSGSIGRGLETAEGGVDVKNSTRSAANLKVTIDDCGSKLGKPIQVPNDIAKATKYIGYSYIENDKTIKITINNLSSLLGKTLLFRNTAFCKASPNAFCKCCSGPNISRYPNGITSVNAVPGSKIMLIKMKGMHGSIAKNIRLRVHDHLS